MGKNLAPKLVLIIVLVVLAAWTLYPPSKTLKPGIDLAGGISLIYEIDTQGLEEHETKDLAQRMIIVQRRRIDPANIQNLIWRPLGNTRFEIQMPLASAEARAKRQNYEKGLNDLLAKNTDRARVMRSLQGPVEQRTEDFNDFAQGDPNRLTILDTLATVYDERKALQGERDKLYSKLKTPESIISITGLDLDEIKLHLGDWIRLSAETRVKRLNYKEALDELLAKNINRARVMRSLQGPVEQRTEDFNDFAQGDPNRLTILETLATVYDERKALQGERDKLYSKLKTPESIISITGLDLDEIKLRLGDWIKLDEEQLTEALKEFLGSEDNLDLLTRYVKMYSEWAEVVEQLTEPETGKNEQYENAKKDLDKLNLTEDQIKFVLEMSSKSAKRRETLKRLKAEFADRAEEIDNVVAVFDEYRPFKGRLTETLKDYLDSEDNLDLLTRYVKMYAEWAEVVEQLTEPETGKNELYENAKKDLDKLNLTEDQIKSVLEMSPKSAKRRETLKMLKAEFADRAEEIDKVVAVFDKYRPFKGRLDDPKDLQRMLKGAGVLEFRILPTQGHPEVDMDEMADYIESLKVKGPKYASDNKYVWCEVENINEWAAADEQKRPSIVGQFGEKYYVLGSNKRDEIILHSAGENDWRLKANPTTDRMGRRAIGFTLDERGGRVFFTVTDKNLERPLCVLLDGIAISAPTIQARIRTQGIITGSFTQTEVEDMVNKLNAGSLPARLIEQPISVKTIGPSIGADNRDKGIKAGLIGLALVVLCMLVYYMLAGSIADVALVMNILFVLAIMAGVRATFTLPGIAGIILTIGMSVDANVLIFERIREEQQKGSSLRIAIKNGYQRAFRTILDANLTTFITAAILLWRASEEVKGFAIVLMLGIASSMFTALFVTRVIFDFLLAKRIIKDNLFMLRLIRKPNINWMAARPIFLCISTLLIAAGLFVFFTRGDKYDIEFTGGTSAQINLKEPRTRQYVEDRIREIANDPNNPNPVLAAANIYSIGNSGKQYEINTTETNKTTAAVTFPKPGQYTVETVISAIKKTEGEFGGNLSNLQVTPLSNPTGFEITTSQMNKSLVKNVLSTAFADANISEPQVERTVNDAILKAFGDELEIQQNLQPEIASEEKISEELIESYPELADFLGGVKITCEIERAATPEEINSRLADLRFKPDMQNLNWSYSYKMLGSDLNEMEPNQPVNSFVYISVEPEAGFRELSEDEWTQFVENERTKVLAATELEGSLPRVRQFAPSVGAEAKTRALIAIILSLFAIVTYIWIRFGNVRYGIAAIVALVHDVCITLGAITACTYIAGTPIGEKLLIGDFKINLAIVAALLTIIGYSLNDTIVVFDRIRENRRKALLNPQIISNSINQTLSRTLITSFTTFIVVLIMYIFGGPGLRGFTFAIGLGIIIGTYSSIAIAAPVLLLGAGFAKTTKKSVWGRTKTKNEKSK